MEFLSPFARVNGTVIQCLCKCLLGVLYCRPLEGIHYGFASMGESAPHNTGKEFLIFRSDWMGLVEIEFQDHRTYLWPGVKNPTRDLKERRDPSMILYQDCDGAVDLISRRRDQSLRKLDLKHENGPGYCFSVMNEFFEKGGGDVIG